MILYHIAGITQWDPALGRLRQVFVAEEFRGSGVGTKLVGRVLEEAKTHGRKFVLVHALLKSKNFYERNGFIEAGEPYQSGERGVTCQKMRINIKEH